MIETIKDTNGKVTAYCSWQRVTRYMEFSPEFTDIELSIAFADELWRHIDCALTIRECIRHFTERIEAKYPNTVMAHFKNHNDERPHWYSKHQLMRGKNGKKRTIPSNG